MTSPFGVKVIAVGTLIYSIIATAINAYPSKKLIGYGYYEQIKDIVPFVLMSILMGIIVYFVGLIPIGGVFRITMQILVGVISYFILSKITKIETLEYSLNMIKSIRKR